MRINQLPKSVYASVNITAGREFTTTIEDDLRIVEVRGGVRAPFRIQAQINGFGWRDLVLRAGRGRAGARGFNDIQTALSKLGKLRRTLHPEIEEAAR